MAYEVINGYEVYMYFNDSYVLHEVSIRNSAYSTTVYPAIDYIGMTVGEVLSIHGYDYNYGSIEGGNFINYDFAEGLWIHAGDNANGIKYSSDTVNYVYIFDGVVTDDISIGMTASQIRNATGLDISLEADEVNGIGYFAYEAVNGLEYYMNFNNSYVLQNVMIKNSAVSYGSVFTLNNLYYSDEEDTSVTAFEGLLLGDVNMDGEITAYDGLKILQNIIDIKKFSGVENAVTDLDMNGAIEATDSLYLGQYDVNLISGFGPENNANLVDIYIYDSGYETETGRAYYDCDKNEVAIDYIIVSIWD